MHERFKLTEKIGEGETGALFLTHSPDGKSLALKAFHPEMIFDKLEVLTPLVSLFENQGSNKIARVLEAGRWKDSLYLVRDYIKGTSLKDLLSEGKKFSIQKSTEIILSIAEGLDLLHSRNVFHGNLKPSNIFFYDQDSEQAVLTDYGLFPLRKNHILYERKTIPDIFYYNAPEQTGLLKRPTDYHCDLYALGIIFYQLLTGKLPFQEERPEKLLHQHLAGKPIHPSVYNPEVPEIIEYIVYKLLQKEPEERFSKIEFLINDLNKFLSDMPAYQKKEKSAFFKDLNFDIDIVGRDKEIQMIDELYHKKENFSQILYIYGKSGLGKSKLCKSFLQKNKEENHQQFYYSCSEASKNIPYSAFINSLKEYWSKESNAGAVRKIKERIIEKLNQKTDILYSLFPFLDEEFLYKNKKTSQKIKEDREEIFYTLIQFLEIVASGEDKIVFFLDDAHWLDNESFNLILRLSQMASGYLFLFILTGNQEKMPLHFIRQLEEYKNNILFYELKKMEKHFIPMMVNMIVNTKQTFPELLYQAVEEISDGNPLFIIEMIKNFYQSQILYFKNERWYVDQYKLKNTDFQKDIFALLIERLSKLEESEKEILSLASVIGNEFSIQLLEKLYENKKGIIDLNKMMKTLERAQEEKIIGKLLFYKNKDYYFYHDKIRETLYLQISLSERKELHLLSAQILEEELKKTENEENIFLITYHYEKTIHKKNFLHYSYLSYEKSLSLYAYEQAAFYLKNFVDFYLSNQLIDREILQKIIDLSFLLQNIGKIEESIGYLEKGYEWACKNNRIEEEIEFLLKIGTAYYLLNRPNALPYYQKALETAEKHKIMVKNPYVYTFLGAIYYFQYELEQADYYLNLSMQFIENGSLENTIRTYGIKCWSDVAKASFEEALKSVKEMEKLIPQIQNPVFLAQIYHYCSTYYNAIDFEKALKYAYLSYMHAEKSNSYVFLYSSLCTKGMVLNRMEKSEQALKSFDEGLEISRKYQIFIGEDMYYAQKAFTLILLKRFEEANQLYEDFQKQKKEVHEGFLSFLVFIYVRVAYFLLKERYEEALEKIDEFLNICENKKINIMKPSGLELKIFILNQMQKTDEAGKIKTKLEDLLKEKPELFFLKTEAEHILSLVRESKNSRKPGAFLTQNIKESFQLNNIVQLAQIISNGPETEDLLKIILDKALEMTGAERGILLLFNPKRQEWLYSVRKNFSNPEYFIPESILKDLESHKKGVLLNDLAFSREENKIFSALITPLIFKDNLIGALYLDSSLLKNLFCQEDLEILKVFTSQASLALSHIQSDSPLLEKQEEEKEKDDVYERFNISNREKEIVQMVLKGLSNNEICEKIFISLNTIKNHLKNIFKKTGVKNRIELVRLFQGEKE